MRARFVSFSSPRRSLAATTLASLGLLVAACGQDIERQEFGDAWVPPADTLGNVGGDGSAQDDEDDGDDDDDDGGGPAGDGPAADDGQDDGGDDIPDPDDGSADDSSVDDGMDDSALDDDGGDDDAPPADDDGGPMESPYVGGWDIGDCQNDIQSTGTSVGDVLPDFTLLDQNGDMVRLYDFCHKAVWLIEGAFW